MNKYISRGKQFVDNVQEPFNTLSLREIWIVRSTLMALSNLLYGQGPLHTEAKDFNKEWKAAFNEEGGVYDLDTEDKNLFVIGYTATALLDAKRAKVL